MCVTSLHKDRIYELASEQQLLSFLPCVKAAMHFHNRVILDWYINSIV